MGFFQLFGFEHEREIKEGNAARCPEKGGK